MRGEPSGPLEPVACVRDRAPAGDATRAAEAVLSLNRGFFSRTGETDREVVDAVTATLALFEPDVGSGTEAALLAALASELVWSGDGERRFGLSDEALAMARRAADPRALAAGAGAAEHDDPRPGHVG